jgi:hypothetical protein
MGVEPVLGIDADPSEHEADRVLTVERAERDVPAVGERAEHLARDGLVTRPRRAHDVEDAVRVLELGERSELDAGRASRLECQLPRVAHHGAGV